MQFNRAQLVDRAAVRRVMAVLPTSHSPEYLRVNFDCGSAMVLHAVGWALATPDMYPTLTLHGSNDPGFMLDVTATVTRSTTLTATTYTANDHDVALAGSLLWQLSWDMAGSRWSPAEVAAGTAEVFQTNLTQGPRYTQYNVDPVTARYGTVQVANYQGFFPPTSNAHRFPPGDILSPVAYRYYALVVSVGAFQVPGSVDRLILELQEFQLIVQAPAPTALPVTGTARFFGRATLSSGTQLVDLQLSKPITTGSLGGLFGYMEIWTQFRHRRYTVQGQQWTMGSFRADANFQSNNSRRALVTLPELMVPRRAVIRTRNTGILGLPYVWCYVRQRCLQPVIGEQASILHEVTDEGIGDVVLAPPAWITARDTLRFLLTVGSGRVPGGSQFLSLYADNPVVADVLDVPGSALPEFCLVLPTGEVLDFLMYDESIRFPNEVPHDEGAGIYATLRIQFTD